MSKIYEDLKTKLNTEIQTMQLVNGLMKWKHSPPLQKNEAQMLNGGSAIKAQSLFLQKPLLYSESICSHMCVTYTHN